MSATRTDPADVYSARGARFALLRDRLGRRSRYLSHGRVIAFVGLLGLGLLLERSPSGALIAATVLAGASFVALIVLHRRTRDRERWFDALATLNAEGLDRLGRR